MIPDGWRPGFILAAGVLRNAGWLTEDRARAW